MDDEKFIKSIVKEVAGHPIDREDIPDQTYTDVFSKELKDAPKYTDSIEQRRQ